MKTLTKKKLRKDYTGQVINGHKCLEYVGSNSNRNAYYTFICKSCGKEFVARVGHANRYDGCGCIKVETGRLNGKLKGKQKDMINKTFGMLTVVSEDPVRRPGSGNIFYNCLCECGTSISVRGHYLKIGHTTSCGCKTRSDSCDVFLSELSKLIDFPIEQREVPLKEFFDTNVGYRYDAIIPQIDVLIEVDGQHVHGPNAIFPNNDQDKNEYAEFLSHTLYRFICNSVDDVPIALIRNSYMINKLKARVADHKRFIQHNNNELGI